jgi:hypothetical protein
MGGIHLDAPVVGIEGSGSNHGYWLVGADGGVFAFGDAPFYGSMSGHRLDAPVVGITSIGDGYYLGAKDGGIFPFGNAPFSGSAGSVTSPVIGIAVSDFQGDPFGPPNWGEILTTTSGDEWQVGG